MKTLIEKLRNLPDESRYHVFENEGKWYDIYFNFDREYIRESGGEPDEMLTTRTKDVLDIKEIHCYNLGGDEIESDNDFINKLETLYNET